MTDFQNLKKLTENVKKARRPVGVNTAKIFRPVPPLPAPPKTDSPEPTAIPVEKSSQPESQLTEMCERLQGLFDKTPQAMKLDTRLQAPDRELYGTMLSLATGHNPKDEPICSATVSQLRERLSRSSRQIYYSKARLQKTGWIGRLSHGDKKPGRYAETYRLFPKPNDGVARHYRELKKRTVK